MASQLATFLMLAQNTSHESLHPINRNNLRLAKDRRLEPRGSSLKLIGNSLTSWKVTWMEAFKT
jgi:hypothetical protein